MNDNEPTSNAEAALMRFRLEHFPDRAAAQWTIVRQHVHLQARRAFRRILIAGYVSHVRWFKPLTLAVVTVAAWAWVSGALPENMTLELAAVVVGLPTLLLGSVTVAEAKFGRLVYHGDSPQITASWRFALSPAFKRKYRESYRRIQDQRRTGLG
ncbi:hypothetical protein [Sphingomonas sp. IC081]|uniref:hypothetical protein n=1 Tax=Sphingomonas sp. IC081 TaxID=304378 RepID=UPI0011582691|nr:hypothetical protein [Sphingomonas sp. IC081]QDK31505.1 hypothetical protein DM450_01540 [Sphingomonas sp. IC081]